MQERSNEEKRQNSKDPIPQTPCDLKSTMQPYSKTLLLAQTAEIEVGQHPLARTQLRNFQIASLSNPKKQDVMLHGLIGSCSTVVLGDKTNTYSKEENKQMGCSDRMNNALYKLPFLCCAADKERSEKSLCHPASPLRQQNFPAFCQDAPGAQSPGTLRKKPLVLEGTRRIEGQLTVKNNQPHPKKDLFPSEPSILETETSSPPKLAPKQAIQSNWESLIDKMASGTSASQQLNEQSHNDDESAINSTSIPLFPSSQHELGAVVGTSEEQDLTTNGEVSIASEFDYDPAKYHTGTALPAVNLSIDKEAVQSFPTTSGEQTERKSASKQDVLSVSSSSSDDYNWQCPQKLLKTIRWQKCVQESGEFDPFEFFGALNMSQIPSEFEPAHELIQKVFNNPLAKKKQIASKKCSRSSRTRACSKSSQSVRQAAVPYKKQGAAPQSQTKATEAAIAGIQVLDLDIASSVTGGGAENSQTSNGILHFPCPINMARKQSSGVYNVGLLTKDKASSTASSTHNNQGCAKAPSAESNVNTPTITVLKGEAKQLTRAQIERDFDQVVATTKHKLASLTARTMSRRALDQAKSTSISSILSGSLLSQTHRANSKKNLTSTTSSTSKTQLVNNAHTLTPRNMNYMSAQMIGYEDQQSQSNANQTLTTKFEAIKLGSTVSTSLRPSDRTLPTTKRSLFQRLQLPRTTPVSANTSPVNLKDTTVTTTTAMPLTSASAHTVKAVHTRHLKKTNSSKTGSQTQSQLRKLLDQVYASTQIKGLHLQKKPPTARADRRKMPSVATSGNFNHILDNGFSTKEDQCFSSEEQQVLLKYATSANGSKTQIHKQPRLFKGRSIAGSIVD